MTIEFTNREELSALKDCDILLKAMGENRVGGYPLTE
jgi:hypothetical protein